MQYSGRDYMPVLSIYFKEWCRDDDQVPAQRTTKYPKWTIFEEKNKYEHVLDKCDNARVYLAMMWKKGAPGAQDKKWPRNSHDVGGETLISWLKTVRKMDAMGSRNGECKFGKNPIYSCRAHIATSFVPVAITIPKRISSIFIDSESTGHRILGVRDTG